MGKVFNSKGRTASFEQTEKGVFVPVNKRAKRYARVLGKRKLQAKEIKIIRKHGAKVRAYASGRSGKLIAIKV